MDDRQVDLAGRHQVDELARFAVAREGQSHDHSEELAAVAEQHLQGNRRHRASGLTSLQQRMGRAPSLNDRPDFLATLADLVEAAPGSRTPR